MVGEKTFKGKLHSILIHSTLICLSIGVALIICELCFRAFYPVRITPRYHTDATYGAFRMRKIRPNSDYWHRTAYGDVRFVTNNRGFRNDEDIQYDKADGELRVVSLGDSHTGVQSSSGIYVFGGFRTVFSIH